MNCPWQQPEPAHPIFHIHDPSHPTFTCSFCSNRYISLCSTSLAHEPPPPRGSLKLHPPSDAVQYGRKAFTGIMQVNSSNIQGDLSPQ